MSTIVKKKKYLSNKDLYMELVYSKAKGKLTPAATNMMMLLGKNVIRKMYYKNPDDRQDCLQEAMLSCFRLWYNFDESKGDNPFAYFTEVIKRGLAKGWNAHYKTKGADVEIISLTAYDNDGTSYDRF
jgi:DNA-directed RNA polymerase specialized sigma24 family protein